MTGGSPRGYIAVASGTGLRGYLISVVETDSLLPVLRIDLPEWESFRPASAGHRLIEHGYMTNSDAHFRPETAAGWYALSETVFAAPVHPTDQTITNEDPSRAPVGLGVSARVEIKFPPVGRRELTNASLYKGSGGIVIGPDENAPGCWFVRIDRPRLPEHEGRETSFRASELRVISPAETAGS